MKSVTIKDKKGRLILKIIHRKKGYEATLESTFRDHFDFEVRDDKGRKVWLS